MSSTTTVTKRAYRKQPVVMKSLSKEEKKGLVSVTKKIVKETKKAVIEAKKEDLPVSEGISQAKDYAQKLKIHTTYSTNGHKIYEINYSKNEKGEDIVTMFGCSLNDISLEHKHKDNMNDP